MIFLLEDCIGKEKSKGAKTVPCGTPEATGTDEIEAPSRTTCSRCKKILDPVVQFPCNTK